MGDTGLSAASTSRKKPEDKLASVGDHQGKADECKPEIVKRGISAARDHGAHNVERRTRICRRAFEMVRLS